jgi:hypothetical protein
MPPQPLLKICPNAGLSFTPESVIDRPEVAAWIGQCMACWSWVETQTSRLFTLLIEVNVEAGVELYNLGFASVKVNAIRVLARSKLATPHYKLIDALLKVIESQEKTRNKIAHWCWGISDQIPDGLVLIDPKQILIRDARIMDKAARGDRQTADDYRYPLDCVYVYRLSDLQADAKAFLDLAGLVNRCHGLARLQGNRLWQLHDELSKDGRLAERLDQTPSGGR